MKKFGIIIGAVFLLGFIAMSGAEAVTINMIENGDFEANGGSLTGWSQSGDVQLYTAVSGNHMAALGWKVNDGDSLISQAFTIENGYFSQTLSFDYVWGFQDISAPLIDVFAASVDGNVQMLLASAYTPANKQDVQIGHYDFLTIPQLNAGTYTLLFKLHEAQGSDTNSLVKLDNIMLTAKVPEPGILLMLGSGLIGLAFTCRKFKG